MLCVSLESNLYTGPGSMRCVSLESNLYTGPGSMRCVSLESNLYTGPGSRTHYHLDVNTGLSICLYMYGNKPGQVWGNLSRNVALLAIIDKKCEYFRSSD